MSNFEVLKCDRPDWDGQLFMKCVVDDGGWISRRFSPEDLATDGLVDAWIAECRKALLSCDQATIREMQARAYGDAIKSLGAAILTGRIGRP